MEEEKQIQKINTASQAPIILISIFIGFIIGFFTAIGMGTFSQGNDTDRSAQIPHSFTKTFVVNDTDFIRGNSNARIILYEYSDFQCPFCTRFHTTAKQILKDSTDVAWVYRHLPLPSHSLAHPAAVAAECIKNNISLEKGWDFVDDLFIKKGFTQDYLQTSAFAYGLSETQYQNCNNKDSVENSTVLEHLKQAQQFGFNGTPNGVIYNQKAGKYENLPGAIPLEQLKQIIESLR